MKPRVLFYVQHLLGVGHVKRAAAIARAAAEVVDLHVALGGEPVALADFGRATVHQLPPARAEDLTFKVLLDADGQPLDAQWWAHRKATLLDLAARIDPQILLVEHYPFGRAKFAVELLPLFEQIRAKPGRRILCSVRDVLVEKGETAKSEKIVRLVRKWFDGVLVHGDASVIPSFCYESFEKSGARFCMKAVIASRTSGEASWAPKWRASSAMRAATGSG